MCSHLGAGEPKIAHVHRKVFLPVPGSSTRSASSEGREVRGVRPPRGRAALLVARTWHSLTATIAALDGAQIIAFCAALLVDSPRRRGSGAGEREPLGSTDSRHRGRHGVSSHCRAWWGVRAACSLADRWWPDRGDVRARARSGTRWCSRSAWICRIARARVRTCRSSPTSRRWCRTSSGTSTTSRRAAGHALEFDPAASRRTIRRAMIRPRLSRADDFP